MDRLAENLARLQEDDLLQAVQMIYDHKSSDSVIKNNVDGESQLPGRQISLRSDPRHSG